MDAVHPHAETEIFMPTTVATATGQDGHKKVFFTIPQIEGLIKRVRDSRPREFTYRWAYHPRHNVHVLFANWPSSDAVGIAIPEGTGDWVLNYMLGVTDIYLTTEPVEHLQGTVNHDEIQKVASGNTVPLFGVKFKPDA